MTPRNLPSSKKGKRDRKPCQGPSLAVVKGEEKVGEKQVVEAINGNRQGRRRDPTPDRVRGRHGKRKKGKWRGLRKPSTRVTGEREKKKGGETYMDRTTTSIGENDKNA